MQQYPMRGRFHTELICKAGDDTTSGMVYTQNFDEAERAVNISTSLQPKFTFCIPPRKRVYSQTFALQSDKDVKIEYDDGEGYIEGVDIPVEWYNSERFEELELNRPANQAIDDKEHSRINCCVAEDDVEKFFWGNYQEPNVVVKPLSEEYRRKVADWRARQERISADSSKRKGTDFEQPEVEVKRQFVKAEEAKTPIQPSRSMTNLISPTAPTVRPQMKREKSVQRSIFKISEEAETSKQ